MIGKTIAHYRITEMIGKGGMGVVYKARDTHLDRSVAIKVLPAEAVADTERRRRFIQEAKAASALNHPNIITIYDISRSDGVDFIAMEHVEGRTLSRFMGAAKISSDQALDLAIQVAGALAAAHAAGIVHRDLKPSNIMITEKGLVKVLDFGLAKLTEKTQPSGSSTAETMTPITDQGAILGTAAYMSPEQAEGKPVDARSDVFSFGTVLYELLSGRRAFQGESYVSTLSAILRDTPTPIHRLRANIPAALEHVVNRCLEKNREARYASATELWKDLNTVQSRLAARRTGFGQILRRPLFAIAALALLAAVAVVIAWYWVRNSHINYARTVAVPEIERLMDSQRPCAALRLVQQVEPYLKNDSRLESLRKDLTLAATIITDPPGADFYVCDYVGVADSAEWLYIGRTPLKSVVVPNAILAFKITKPDFESVDGTARFTTPFQTTLRAKGTSPPGMIWVPARQAGRTVSAIMTEPIRDFGFEGYWLDRYELTNKQFKVFVDRGAYEKQEYWKYPFVKDGRVISWEAAMSAFKDTTGRPGPATWEFGTYPPDRADYPASGVSWYEAAAYAEFAGKSLPTVHHWAIAAGNISSSSIMQVSNFAGKGPVRVGSLPGLSPYGNYDMAGNVKEWCLNPSGTDRYILGGAWNEPSYTFYVADVRSPMDRSAVNGFRCAKYTNPLRKELTGNVKLFIRDRRGDKPANDSIYKIYKAIHQYDHGDLKAVIESSDDSFPYWRCEKVSFQAAYGNERIPCYLYLPKNATPPYQTVVHFPGAYAIYQSSQSLDTSFFDFIIRSGRAVIQPIYKGTYERASGLTLMTYHTPSNIWRGIAIDNAKDLGRSLDYLETRPDIDRERLAYYGFSMGAAEGPRMIALEPRLKVGVLLHGGAYERERAAEVDPFNFAPRVHVPILMLNGRYDVIVPLEGSQIPLFQALGTSGQDKKHFVVDGGHGLLNQEIIKEALAWLDRYLGPVHAH